MTAELRARIVRAFAIYVTTVLGTLLLLALLAVPSQEPRPQCMDAEMREHIRAVTLEGYDLALRNHAVSLFAVWLREPHEEPKRASAASQQGIGAYTRAVALARSWQPPLC